jgi:hypothetical protein
MSFLSTLGPLAKGLVSRPSTTINSLIKSGGGVAGAAANIISAGNIAKTVVLSTGAAVTGGVLAGGLLKSSGSLPSKLSGSTGTSSGGSLLSKLTGGGSTSFTSVVNTGRTLLGSILPKKVETPALPNVADKPLSKIQETVFSSPSMFTSGGYDKVKEGVNKVDDFYKSLPDTGTKPGTDPSKDSTKKAFPVWGWFAIAGGFLLSVMMFVLSKKRR